MIRPFLAVLFIGVPLLELYLLLAMSQVVGWVPTIALTVLTGVVGSWLAKREGLRAWRTWQRSLNTLSAPEIGLLEGALILVGGALLITPGVVTDLFGFCLLLPWTRKPASRWLRRRAQSYLDARQGIITVSADVTR